MSLYAFDGANPAFDLTASRRAGGIVATVYIVGTPGGMPHADAARVAAIRAVGMGVLPNWERAADFYAHASLADAKAAGVEALAACRSLGFPDDGSIDVAFSFDYNITPANYPDAAADLAATNQGLAGRYRAVAYGPIGFLNYLAAHGQTGPHWLMASTFRASSQFAAAEIGQPHVAMVQSHDAAGNWLSTPVPGTDINTVTNPYALGAWWPDGSPYAGGLHMDADVKARFDAIDQRLTALFQVDTTGDGKSDITGTVQAAVRAELAGVVKLLAEVAPRVAATQVAVASVGKALAAIVPGVVDVSALADAVSTKVKSLAWKAV